MYSVFFDRDVEKDIARIPKNDVRRIMERCLALTAQPRSTQSIKLEGTQNMYRLRAGNYRVIYQIDDRAKTVTVYHIRHRQSAYRDF